MGPNRAAGRAPIRSLAEIPFDRCDPLALLGLREARAEPDPDYVRFGHARLDRIWLDDGDKRNAVRGALLLALHSCDLGEPRPDDVVLEFFVDEVAPGYSVTALLSAFLAARLPALRGDEEAIVLAMCNPHRAALAHPAAAGPVPVHYALGDVESWLDLDLPGVRLRAPAWRVAGGD
jgi:hypothetical protein